MNKSKNFTKNFLRGSALYDLIFAYAIYNLMFNLRGLSVFEISLLLSFWAFSAVLLEVPSGALADYWNRKKILVIAPLIKACCFLIWFFAGSNILLLALGFFCWSLGSSLVSGTAQAILYDKLASVKQIALYEKILSRKKFYFHISLAIAFISGGIIAQYSIDLVLLLSILPLLFSSYFFSRLENPPKVKSTEEVKYLDHILSAIKEFKSNRMLLILAIYGLCISILGSLEELDQLFYQFIGLPIYAYGIIGFAWSILNSLSAKFAYRLKGKSQAFILIPIIAAISLFIVSQFATIPILIILLFAYFVTTPLTILIESRIQHEIKTLSRATITSVYALLVNLLGAILVPFLGLISSRFELPAIYFTGALFLIFAALMAVFNRKVFI